MEKHPKSTAEKNVSNSRRGFLKKAVYTAPALMVLGALAKPKDAKAGGLPPGPPPSLAQAPVSQKKDSLLT